MENEFKRIVEINGIKVEVDLRTAKRVDTFKVGDAVKILKKKYDNQFESYFGMIVGFDEFKNRPTIIVAYLDNGSWSDSPLKLEYITQDTKDTEIVTHGASDIGVQKCDIMEHFDRQIIKKKSEIEEMERKRHYFVTMFGKYFQNEKSNTA